MTISLLQRGRATLAKTRWGAKVRWRRLPWVALLIVAGLSIMALFADQLAPLIMPAGSQPSPTANTWTSAMPTQKVGRDCPNIATPLAAESIRPPRCTAATTPSGMPAPRLSTSASDASGSDAPSRSTSSAPTGSPERSERPKSPFTALSANRPYWMMPGRSSPRLVGRQHEIEGIARRTTDREDDR